MAEFLPIFKRDMAARGWDELDFICVTGDAYVDHPSFGIAIISRLLESLGYKVGSFHSRAGKTSPILPFRPPPVQIFCHFGEYRLHGSPLHCRQEKAQRRSIHRRRQSGTSSRSGGYRLYKS